LNVRKGVGMELKELEVYQISRELSRIAWEVYSRLDKEYRYGMGRQFLNSTDSVGANIAEGYGRFHYLDSVKFYYNARGSHYESRHWQELLTERKLISDKVANKLVERYDVFGVKLNNFISSVKRRAKQ
jgi:four helix bundle protein